METHAITLSRTVTRSLPELTELFILSDHAKEVCGEDVRIDTLAELEHGDERLPLVAFRFGPSDPQLPVLALVAGVHGLERIGTSVVLAYLRTLVELARWDRTTRDLLANTRLLVIPLVNPVGMLLQRRANGNRVDLMRNAPVTAEGLNKWRLFGGHRITPRLPWYMGQEGAPMETENQVVSDFLRRELFKARVAISLDVHSGYGKLDRLWFPFANNRQPFPKLAEVVAVRHLLDRAHPNHVYCIEPQSSQYLAHGDLWDFMYEEYQKAQPEGTYLPLTLELGSWLWIRKNWVQAFSALGVFNPKMPHRVKRTLRRHLFLFELLHRASNSPEAWSSLNPQERERLRQQGMAHWYPESGRV